MQAFFSSVYGFQQGSCSPFGDPVFAKLAQAPAQDPYDRDRTEAGSETGRLLVEQSWGIPETAASSEGHGKYRRDTEVPG